MPRLVADPWPVDIRAMSGPCSTLGSRPIASSCSGRAREADGTRSLHTIGCSVAPLKSSAHVTANATLPVAPAITDTVRLAPSRTSQLAGTLSSDTDCVPAGTSSMRTVPLKAIGVLRAPSRTT